MPWSQVTVVDQREEFVRLARLTGANISDLCRRFQISRKTGYKWLGRESLEDRSRRPHSTPGRTPEALEAKVLRLRDDHPDWGGRKIARILQRHGDAQLPPSTVTAVLHRHGRISEQASQAATHWQRFEHDAPNSLWQMDFKGHFATATERCHPLTVLDDHSRFSIVLQALPDEQRSSVEPVLQRAFEHFGLPDRINVDNGTPWGTQGRGGLTKLAVWMIRLGITLSYSRPFHPQTNGKDERFHRTLSTEVLARHSFADIADAQARFSNWRHVYNFERPHDSLGLETPSSRYRPSLRRMPKEPPPIEYLAGDLVRKVQEGGWFSLNGREFRTSRALAGQAIACRPLEQDGDFAVFFCQQKVDEISLKETC